MSLKRDAFRWRGSQLDRRRRVIDVRQVEIALLTRHGPAAEFAKLPHYLAALIEHDGIERAWR